MGADSKIEWCDHTFNPWVGCAKISPACTNCYAEGWAKRTGQAGLWRGERRRTSVANWREPLKWDRAAAAEEKDTGKASTMRVFCASLADVFESHEAIDPQWRTDLWELIARTPFLTWLLLTKRPENVRSMVPSHWLTDWPARVWLGTTVEDQARADERIPHLLRCPAKVRFLSCEPLLGPLDLRLQKCSSCAGTGEIEGDDCTQCDGRGAWQMGPGDYSLPHMIDWVIAGGESGPKARPTHPDWARSLRDQCDAAGVPFFFKQWGEWRPATRDDLDTDPGGPSYAIDRTGRRKDPTEAFDPVAHDCVMVRVGKTAAGAPLDGQRWQQFPGGVR